MLGTTVDTLVGLSTRELVHPDDQALAVSTWVGLLATPGGTVRIQLRMLRGDGTWLWVDSINHNLLADPAQRCVIGDLIDISREMELREDVRARERLLHRLTQALPVGLVQVAPGGEVLYANEQLLRMLGTSASGSLAEQLATIVPADRDRLSAAFLRARQTGQDDALQVRVTGGAAAVCAAELRPIVDDAGNGEGVLLSFTDVTEAVRLRAELEQQVSHDTLTGCLNRAAVVARLRLALADVGPGNGCAVLFLDLDGFKAVNDTQGHAAGDQVLRDVAEVLRAATRAGDAVGRLGGDEFVLVCPGVPGEDAALHLARDIGARLRRSGASVRASTGVYRVLERDADADAVLARADAAMYLAKTSRLGAPVLWRPEARAT